MPAYPDHNRLGIDAAMKGDLQTAEREFRKALLEHPKHPGILLNICRLLQMQQRHHEIITLFQDNYPHRAKIQPPPQLSCLIAQSAIALSDDDLVIDLLSNLSGADAQYPEVAIPLSEACLRRGQLNQAQLVLEQALQKNPGDPSLLTNLAIVTSERGDYEQAEILYRKVIAGQPNHFLGHFNLGKFLALLGHVDSARQCFRTCLNIVPGAPEAEQALLELSEQDDAETTSNYRASALQLSYAAIEKKDWEAALQNLSESKDLIDPIRWKAAVCELPQDYQNKLGNPLEYSPTNVVKIEQLFESDDGTLQELIKDIKRKASLVWNRAGKPTREGYQTHEILAGNKSKIWSELTQRLETSLYKHIKNNSSIYGSLDKKSMRLSGWAVILKKGGFQKRHIHPEAKVSGVLYLSVPKETSSPDMDEGNLLFSTLKPMAVSPIAGQVVIFPSYMPHETIPQESSDERICIAFNAV